jgi:uncharacterized protein YdhG (YjbR/CyaY superfamily)
VVELEGLNMKASKARTVDEYIKETPPHTRAMLKQLRAIVKKAAPDAVEGISYHMPMYKYRGMLLGFCAFERHIGFYAISQPIIKRHAKELEGFVTGKGSIQLPLERKLPVALLRAMVKERVAEKDAKDAKARR